MAEAVTTRSLTEIVNELRVELKEFVQTRLEMLKSELNDKIKTWKMAAPMLAIALFFGFIGFCLLTAALCAAIAWAIGWGYSLLAVGLAYCAIAGVSGFLGYKEFTAEGMMPKRTMKVLKQDQAWLQSEAKSV